MIRYSKKQMHKEDNDDRRQVIRFTWKIDGHDPVEKNASNLCLEVRPTVGWGRIHNLKLMVPQSEGYDAYLTKRWEYDHDSTSAHLNDIDVIQWWKDVPPYKHETDCGLYFTAETRKMANELHHATAYGRNIGKQDNTNIKFPILALILEDCTSSWDDSTVIKAEILIEGNFTQAKLLQEEIFEAGRQAFHDSTAAF